MMEHNKTEQDFIARLTKGISHLPDAIKSEILEDIRLHFTEGRENGEDTASLIQRLGNPEDLAHEYCEVNNYAGQVAEAKPRGPLAMASVAIGVCVFNLLLPLPVFCVLVLIWVVLASGALISVLSLVTTALVVVNMITPLAFVAVSHPLAALFASIALVALGLLMLLGAIVYGKLLMHLSIRYIRWNLAVISGRRSGAC